MSHSLLLSSYKKSRLDKAQEGFWAAFLIAAFLMALMTIWFAYDQFTSVPVRSARLMLGVASIMLALHGVIFALYLWSEFRPDRTLIRSSETILGTVWVFIRGPSTIYVAVTFAFAYALYKGSGLYLPFLAASLVSLAGIVWSMLPSLVAASQGGGAGLSEDDME
jgi:hypothetical protein